MIILKYFFWISTLWLLRAFEIIKPRSEDEIKIAFGSGNNKALDERTKIFYSVARYGPDIWIWLGDSTYLDDRVVYGLWSPNKNVSDMKYRYQRIKEDPAYLNLKNNTKKIVGIWNAHDYGLDGGDINFANKTLTKKLFLDFLNEPRGSERRELHEGIYNSYYIGEKKRVKLILLDCQYNKEANDILGDKQWKWFERQLWDNDASVTIIASAIQIMPDDRYFTSHWDETSRNKLYKLLKKTNTKGPILLSGDAGFAEILSDPCSKKIFGHDLYEATSNGLTFSMSEDVPFGQYFQTFLFPETYNKADDRYNKKNFGILEIKFSSSSNQEAQIHLEIRNDLGTSSVSKYFDLESITPDAKKRKEALHEQCESEKSVNYRRIAQIMNRLKQFDIFFIFVLSLPFVTVWLLYISIKQFREIFSSCCSDEELKEEEDQIEKEEEPEEEDENESEKNENEEEIKEEKQNEKDKKSDVIEKEESYEKITGRNLEENEKENNLEEKQEKNEKNEEEEWNVVKRKGKPKKQRKKIKMQ